MLLLISLLAIPLLAVAIGSALGYAAIHLKVERDPLIDQINALLPNGQCGQCGFPGCGQAAQAIVDGRAEARAACGSDHLLAGFMGTGIFEQCHFLMGFEDTLTNLYAHPDEMHALIDYITEYRLTYVRMLIDHLQPDVIFSHDDWGTKNALFMKPEMWREFFKEPYRRFYGYIRSRGVIAIHHADSYLVPIVDDMAEIGIQVWQGVLPENDIPALQAHLNGRLTLMGGFGAAIDRKDATPEDILTYARDVLKRNCPGGHYIPSITYGLAGTVYPHVDKYLNQAVDEYNAALHVPVTHLPPVPRRSVHAPAAPAQSAPEARASRSTRPAPHAPPVRRHATAYRYGLMGIGRFSNCPSGGLCGTKMACKTRQAGTWLAALSP